MADGTYVEKGPDLPPLDSQQFLMDEALKHAAHTEEKPSKAQKHRGGFFGRLFGR